MKKKLLIIWLGLCMAAMFAGCGKEKSEGDTNENTQKEQESQGDQAEAKEGVTLGEYKGLDLTLENPEITDEDVKAYIENILSRTPSYTPTDKTVVEDGDCVNIDYEGLLDGVAFDRGSATNQVLEIGSNNFIEGFEEGLIGANVGDTKALNLTFPDPYQNNPDLAGKPVVFNVKINSIVEKHVMTYEDLTDEYVAANFGQETLEAYEASVKESLASSSAYYAQGNTRTAVIEKLQEICTVNGIPQEVMDERIAKYKDQVLKMCESQGMELSDYLAQYQTTEEEFNAQAEEYVKKNVEFEMIVQAIADQEGIKAEGEDYESFLSEMMANNNFETEEALFAEYDEDYVKTIYLGNKVVDFVIEHAKGAEGSQE